MEFRNEQDLQTVKKELMPVVKKNIANLKQSEAYEGWYEAGDYADGSR